MMYHMGCEERNDADDPVSVVPVVPIPVPVESGVADWVFLSTRKVEVGPERGGEAGKEVEVEVGVKAEAEVAATHSRAELLAGILTQLLLL